jgi:hypothetical protein
MAPLLTKPLFGSERAKMSDYLDSNRGTAPPLGSISEAVAAIGTGANGTVNIIAVDGLSGAAGNSATVEVVDPTPTNGPLSAVDVAGVLTVTLAVAAGVLDTASNTATLVAAAIDALDDFSATASGTGADSLALDEGPTSFAGGSFQQLSSNNFGPQALAGSGTTEASNSRAFTKDRMHVLSVGAEPLRVLFGPLVGTGSDVPAAGGAIIPANIMFYFRTGVGARFVYIEAADGASPYEASVWQREA